MKPTPLLDFWQKPPGAGDPIAVLATTFALDPDFFEQNCLARFLEVSSVDEDAGTVDDIVASVELHELLQNTRVAVLADRSAPAQRSSLLWDLLSCQVPYGLLHAKVSVLLWQNATRVILGSANLTAAGYRRQIELSLAADLGPVCLFPPDVLTGIADELESYLRLVPGSDPGAAVIERAAETLRLFRQRVASQTASRSPVRVAFAPTNSRTRPLDRLPDVWNGPQPVRATHLSPFWDSANRAALSAARRLLTGRPADSRRQQVAVVLGPRGQTSFSQHLAGAVDSVRELKPLDQEVRTLHAKCLIVESDRWVAALVGSSNHTVAGLGLASHSHREMNLWLGASKGTREGKALLDLVQLGRTAPADSEEVEPMDEDEEALPLLPGCFGLCRVVRNTGDSVWELHLGIRLTDDMPVEWWISVDGNRTDLTRLEWEADGAPATTVLEVAADSLPMCVFVVWDGGRVPWAVVADDPHALPPGPHLSSLRAQHLLDALATGRSLAQVLREELERQEADGESQTGIALDPLKRFELEGSLLRKGRALAASLAAMQRRVERSVVATDTLRARLAGPLGPEYVGLKVVEAVETGQQSRAEALFTVAEIALVVGRVDWNLVLELVGRDQGLILVQDTVDYLDALVRRLGDQPADIAAYARRAVGEARRCVTA